MLKKLFAISMLSVCGIVGVSAVDETLPKPPEQENAEVAPGLLVCNEKEENCVKIDGKKQDGDNEEKEDSSVLSCLRDEDKQEDQLLACRDCQ